MQEQEIWKESSEYRNYEVSNFGNIRHKGSRKNRKLQKTYRGYLCVLINHNGKNKNILVHRVVAKEFVDNPYNYTIVNHKDGNKSNNHADNLEWVTQSENVLHAYRELHVKPWNRKLSDDDIRKIRNDTRRHKDIASDFNVAKSQISLIKRRVIYKDVI